MQEADHSGHTFVSEDSALVELKWKKDEGKYTEITVRGTVKLKRSIEDPTDFCLKIKPDDGADVMMIPLPVAVDWKITSERAENRTVSAQVVRMSFASPECNIQKLRLKIGLPFYDYESEHKAQSFADSLIRANAKSGGRKHDERRPMLSTYETLMKAVEIPSVLFGKSTNQIQSNPLLRRDTQFEFQRNIGNNSRRSSRY